MLNFQFLQRNYNNFLKIARVISRILYLGINLSRLAVTRKLELGIGFSSDREHWLSNLPFPLHHIQFTKTTAHTVASSVAFTSNDFSRFSSKLDSIVSVALVVLRFYELYILAEVVIFYAALMMSRLSSSKNEVDTCPCRKSIFETIKM